VSVSLLGWPAHLTPCSHTRHPSLTPHTPFAHTQEGRRRQAPARDLDRRRQVGGSPGDCACAEVCSRCSMPPVKPPAGCRVVQPCSAACPLPLPRPSPPRPPPPPAPPAVWRCAARPAPRHPPTTGPGQPTGTQQHGCIGPTPVSPTRQSRRGACVGLSAVCRLHVHPVSRPDPTHTPAPPPPPPPHTHTRAT
jgi:hypothetical protein